MAFFPSTYTVQDVLTEIKRTFGDEAGVQITDADIYRWIDRGQIELFSSLEVKKAVSNTNLIAGQSSYDISALKILKIHSIRVKGLPASFVTFQEFEKYIVPSDPQNTASGTPCLWTEWAGSIQIYPTPDTGYTGGLTIYYLPAPAKVVNTTDVLSIPDSYYNKLIDYVLSKAYELDEDPQNSQFKLTQFQQGVSELANRENMPQVAFYPTITVLPEDE